MSDLNDFVNNMIKILNDFQHNRDIKLKELKNKKHKLRKLNNQIKQLKQIAELSLEYKDSCDNDEDNDGIEEIINNNNNNNINNKDCDIIKKIEIDNKKQNKRKNFNNRSDRYDDCYILADGDCEYCNEYPNSYYIRLCCNHEFHLSCINKEITENGCKRCKSCGHIISDYWINHIKANCI